MGITDKQEFDRSAMNISDVDSSEVNSSELDVSEALCFEKQICFSLYSASNAMVRAYRPELKILDLTYLQYIVMIVLWEQDGLTVSALGNKLHLDTGTLTPLITRLELKSYIKRQLDKKDERVKCLYVTKAGLLLKQKALSIPEKVLCKTALPYEQLIELKNQCDDLFASLEH